MPAIFSRHKPVHPVLDSPCCWNQKRRASKPRTHGTVAVKRPRAHNTSLAPPSPENHSEQNEELEALLDRVSQRASSVQWGQTTVFTGTGRQFGLKVDWSLRMRAADGAFREEITCPWLSFTTGFDGIDKQGTNTSWDVDNQGVPHSLHLDDHEVTVLVAWLRTGAWASPVLRPNLSISVPPSTPPNQNEDTMTLIVRLKAMGSVYVIMTLDKHTARAVKMDVHLCGDKETWEFGEWRESEHASGVSVAHPTLFEHSSIDGAPQLLEVADVHLSPSVYRGDATQLGFEFELESALYSMPTVPLVPHDTTFLPDVPAAVPAWRTKSGHVVVKATVLGVEKMESDCDDNCDRYFILDTGASGFVIEPSAADELGLSSFGEVYITGMAGKLMGKFRKGKSFRLGPLELKDPVMMEMSCSGLVQGGPGPVVGIVGFDVFRRAVVDIPAVVHSTESRPRADVTSLATAMALSVMPKPKEEKNVESEIYIYVYHPENEAALHVEGNIPVTWVPVTMLSALPHVEVQLSPPPTAAAHADDSRGQRQSYLMMIDTGAGGMDMMLNSSAAQALGMASPPGANNGHNSGQRSIRGVGGSAVNPVVFNNSLLKRVRIGEKEFSNVTCLVASPGAGGGVELSHASAGILCGDLLKRVRIIMDLPRSRMAIIH